MELTCAADQNLASLFKGDFYSGGIYFFGHHPESEGGMIEQVVGVEIATHAVGFGRGDVLAGQNFIKQGRRRHSFGHAGLGDSTAGNDFSRGAAQGRGLFDNGWTVVVATAAGVALHLCNLPGDHGDDGMIGDGLAFQATGINIVAG